MKKLKASVVWGSKPFVAGACEDCVKKDDLDCKFAALNKRERNAVVVSCKLKVRREDGK